MRPPQPLAIVLIAAVGVLAATGASAQEAYRAVATATRSPRTADEVTASTRTIAEEQIDHSPSLTTDALLRSVPSVATFRRSYGLVADPTSQGLNLRGLGPSGVSRTLVLVDGVPANDPFGGWIYFRALPRLGLARIDIVHGGGSALYGNAALGGVVQLVSRSPWRPSLDADIAYGSYDTVAGSARVAGPFGRFAGALEVDGLRSDGYPVVAEAARGPIDGSAASAHGNLRARFEWSASERLILRSTLGFFREHQDGGTRFTTASVDQGSAAIEAELDAQRGGVLLASFFARVQAFEQQRARVAAERASETRAALQHVPSEDQGGALVWSSRPIELGGIHALGAGFDVRRAQGHAHEQIFTDMPQSLLLRRRAGGEQLLGGIFIHDSYKPARWLLLEASARFDAVRNTDGERLVDPAGEPPSARAFPDRTMTALSPRLGARVRVTDELSVLGSIYRAFRAPTLNELYRPFQVGTVLTAANAELEPERLTGTELGVELTPMPELRARATGFWNVLSDPITNATLATPLPDGAQRQRRNLGSGRVRGVEVEVLAEPVRGLSIELAYTLAESRVLDAGAMSELVGKQLPQDPVHRGSAQLMLEPSAALSLGAQLRAVGPQYEDDLNTLRMDGYAVIDASFSAALAGPLELFVALENLLDATYLVGRAGVDTIGQPFMARVGLRLRARDLD